MNKAAFSLDKYVFEKAQIDFSKNTKEDLDISFNPKGEFLNDKENSRFELSFEIIVHNGDVENPEKGLQNGMNKNGGGGKSMRTRV